MRKNENQTSGLLNCNANRYAAGWIIRKTIKLSNKTATLLNFFSAEFKEKVSHETDGSDSLDTCVEINCIEVNSVALHNVLKVVKPSLLVYLVRTILQRALKVQHKKLWFLIAILSFVIAILSFLIAILSYPCSIPVRFHVLKHNDHCRGIGRPSGSDGCDQSRFLQPLIVEPSD